MDTLLTATIEMIEKKCPLQPMAVAPELERINYPLGLLRLRYYNWESDRIRKMYVMRMRMRIFKLDILGIGIFPRYEYDAPVFIYDLSGMRKKMVTYINLAPLPGFEDRQAGLISPLAPVHARYRHFPPYPKVAEWFKAMHTPVTLYALPDISCADEVRQAALDYLSHYLDMLYAAEPLTDPAGRAAVQDAQTSYCATMFEKDSSRRMLGRIIGMQRCDRIFHEILT